MSLTIVNVDTAAINNGIWTQEFIVEGAQVWARPLNADDFWMLKALFPDWATLNVLDLFDEDCVKVEVFVWIVWLGVRRDTFRFRSKRNAENHISNKNLSEWKAVFEHIIDVEFVSSELSKYEPPLIDQLKKLDTSFTP